MNVKYSFSFIILFRGLRNSGKKLYIFQLTPTNDSCLFSSDFGSLLLFFLNWEKLIYISMRFILFLYCALLCVLKIVLYIRSPEP